MVLRTVVGAHVTCEGVYLLIASSGHNRVLFMLLALLEICVGFGFLIGFLTPLSGMLAALGYLVFAVQMLLAHVGEPGGDILTIISLIAISVALILLGPGAFSLDARLFGRREIIIPAGRRPLR